MKTLFVILKRNIKLFFKDKGLFFTAMITPVILLILYVTFLENVYWDSFEMSVPSGMEISETIIGSAVGGELVSSLLAVCCVTISFCSNMLMVQDKITGARQDMMITPVRGQTLAFGYYLSTLAVTMIISLLALGGGMLYLAVAGWYLTVTDILLLIFDVFLLVMFGTALSSIINFFLSSQGQISAVGTIVSSGYGFLCGAYMPISQFPEGLRRVISFLPGTYGTSLIRNHAMRGAFEAMEEQGIPQEVIRVVRDSVDCNLYFFDHAVPLSMMYLILGGSIVLLVGIYVLLNILKQKKR
ncbi:MAG: ABC transporter permease [Clostridia bacterium]|nr:ABC transporter permease [Clostridia bacterium]